MKDELEAGAKIAGALSKPLVKLIEVVSNGVGAVAGPPLQILNAHYEGKAALIRQGYAHQLQRLEARQAAEIHELPYAAPRQLPSGELGPDEIEIIFENEDVAEVKRAANAVATQALRRRANAMAVLGEAADQIGDTVSSEPVEADWIARFFDSSRDVSAADIQKLWGKLLAREVEAPGAIPLRALDILRNMNRSEAILLQLCRYRARVSVCRGARAQQR